MVPLCQIGEVDVKPIFAYLLSDSLANRGEHQSVIGYNARRLRESRGLSLETVAREANMTWQYLSRLERGERRFNEDNLMRVAEALGCTPAELVVADRAVPIFGDISGDEYVTVADEHTITRRVPAPFLPGRVVAIVVHGDSLFPKYEDGDTLFFEPQDVVPPDAVGFNCVVGLSDGTVMVKKLQHGSRDGVYRLRSHRSPDIEDVEVSWAARIICVSHFCPP